MGFMHATPGEMKSLRSSAERIALMLAGEGGGGAGVECGRRASFRQSAAQHLCSRYAERWRESGREEETTSLALAWARWPLMGKPGRSAEKPNYFAVTQPRTYR